MREMGKMGENGGKWGEMEENGGEMEENGGEMGGIAACYIVYRIAPASKPRKCAPRHKKCVECTEYVEPRDTSLATDP